MEWKCLFCKYFILFFVFEVNCSEIKEIFDRTCRPSKQTFNYTLNCKKEHFQLPKLPVNLTTSFISLTHSKRFVFIGDSTMEGQFRSFCWSIHRRPVVIETYEQICSNIHLNVSVHFLGYGRVFGWLTTLNKRHLNHLSSISHSWSSSDVVLLNVGLHFQDNCLMSSHNNQHNDFNLFENSLKKLLHVLNLTSVHCKEQKENLPLFIFRDSYPQHFQSSNGQYPLHEIGVVNLTRCVSYSPERIAGKALGSNCNPSCLPATHQIQQTLSILNSPSHSSCSIPFFHLFDVLACLPALHLYPSRGDCTHYDIRVDHHVNRMYLQFLSSLKR